MPATTITLIVILSIETITILTTEMGAITGRKETGVMIITTETGAGVSAGHRTKTIVRVGVTVVKALSADQLKITADMIMDGVVLPGHQPKTGITEEVMNTLPVMHDQWECRTGRPGINAIKGFERLAVRF